MRELKIWRYGCVAPAIASLYLGVVGYWLWFVTASIWLSIIYSTYRNEEKVRRYWKRALAEVSELEALMEKIKAMENRRGR